MATIMVGVDDTPRSEDAIALAGDLARSAGAEIVAVCAFPFDDHPEAHFNFAMRGALRDAAEEALERLCEPLSDVPGVRRILVADLSPARALFEAAAGANAALIVVGSSHAGYFGRLAPGSTVWRLLQGAPCSVAVARLERAQDPQQLRVGLRQLRERARRAHTRGPGPGRAARVISAMFAPLPPSRTRMSREPSAKWYTKRVPVAVAVMC